MRAKILIKHGVIITALHDIIVKVVTPNLRNQSGPSPVLAIFHYGPVGRVMAAIFAHIIGTTETHLFSHN